MPRTVRQMPIDLERVRALRLKKAMSQQDAADAAGLAGGRQAWNNLERGRIPNISLATAEAVARALGVKVDELLKSEGK